MNLRCKKNLSPTENPEITLEVDEIAVSEVWLNLKIKKISSQLFFELERDGIVVWQGNVENDTLIYDGSLEPYKNYHYQGTFLDNKTNEIDITTMDTTSHDISWELQKFGDIGSSNLRDVVIINEDDIWLVGTIMARIMIPDILGYAGFHYSGVHWNGSSWEMRYIKDQNTQHNDRDLKIWGISHPASNLFLYGAFVSFEAGIFIGDNSFTAKNDNETKSQITRFWAASKDNIYACGKEGLLMCYQNNMWQPVETRFSSDIKDIWGCVDEQTGDNFIIGAVSLSSLTEETLKDYFEGLIKINKNHSLENIVLPDIHHLPFVFPTTVWFKSPKKIYMGGGGLFELKKGKGWVEYQQFRWKYNVNSIRGNDINDIFCVMDDGSIGHFNGKSWHFFSPPCFLKMTTLTVKDNLVIAVGEDGCQACVLIGRKIN